MVHYLWAAALIVMNTAWLGLDIVGLPGNWLIVVSTGLVAWVNWGRGMFSVWTLAAMAVLAVAGEAAEFGAGYHGARRAGASRSGARGALVGGLAGGIVGTFVIPVPLVGSLIGAAGGAFAGAMAFELLIGRDTKAAVRSGVGAGVGRGTGTAIKILCGVILWIVAAVAALWP